MCVITYFPYHFYIVISPDTKLLDCHLLTSVSAEPYIRKASPSHRMFADDNQRIVRVRAPLGKIILRGQDAKMPA